MVRATRSAEAIDLEAIDTGTLVGYALDASGTIWLNRDLPVAEWAKLSVPATFRPIVAIAALADGDTPQVLGVDATGNVFVGRGFISAE